MKHTNESITLTNFEKFICYAVVIHTVKKILKKQIFKKNK